MQLVTQSTELEMQMNAIERLQYFAGLTTEKQEGRGNAPEPAATNPAIWALIH